MRSMCGSSSGAPFMPEPMFPAAVARQTVRQGGVDFVEAPANELELGNEMSMKEKEQE